MVDKGVMPKRLIAKGMAESEPYVIEIKDGRLKPGDVMDEFFIDNLKRKKDIEKAHQYNRRTDFKVLLDVFYDEEKDRVIDNKN